ncbi:MAG: thioether cross-link-forming SCIFF peptide maturase [Clostridiales bacterium]|nr:thioether cross-link-forming SCIFF peptide maturase [Clostridiales bacterium]
MNYDENLAHLYSFDGDSILLDIHSGAVHLLDEEAYLIINLWRMVGCSLEDLPSVWSVLVTGPEQDEVTDPDTQQSILTLAGRATDTLVQDLAAIEATHVWEICEELSELASNGILMTPGNVPADYLDSRDSVVKALCLHVAHDCNLRCQYCFAGAGAFGGDRSLMSYETGKKALDFLFDASGTREHVEVDYFGGEPLMNFGVVKKLIHYGKKESARRGKILKQTLTTNGVLLQGKVLDFLNENDVSLVLSLDGRQEVNDRMRPTVSGQGSYEVILPHFKDVVEGRGGDNYYIRGTYTRSNKDFFEDVRHIVESGFTQVSVEPVVALPTEEYALGMEDLPALFEQYDYLARYYLRRTHDGKPFSFFHFNLDLDQGPCLPKRLTGCGAGNDYLAVSPEGDLYPCHQFMGNTEFILGNIHTGVGKPAITQMFRESHVLSKEKCQACWARYYCGGGCHANAWNMSQDLREPYLLGCELEKKRLECAIWIKAKEAQKAQS